ncbi:Dorsal-ventral patterning protein tolloid-like [Homarus americanus]|uniref:Dorsal-ventral patterning protein tolloid-like n=2 Tax=Homarus americanus TaxID=6706 RepID=A0A8J5N597_HOMAM|nr:Dorsal-ventral patterning protein tolloid-like [Homarus americanus]
MQIEELSRPLNAGFWCGTSWGHNVYYSETTAITLMLRVFNISHTNQDMPNPGSFQQQDTIMLRLSYRFLRKERAILRYGKPYSPSYRGEDLPNSFCDKYFENCDKKNCKIQSPNFPGMYPRNLTCYYHIRQTRVPEGKVALVSVYQRNPHLIYIKDHNVPHMSREKRLKVGASCHTIYDYLVAFDGNTTRSPVLAKLCKGGAPLSSLIASGPDLLLLFHASPYDFPFQDSPRRRTFGFELDVAVEFVDRESTAYVRKGSECEYQVNSQGQRSGYVQASAHSLLPNTTCTWRLLAGNTEIVWLYFLHYRHVNHPEMPKPAKCSNTLSIYNGDIPLGSDTNSSSLLLGRFCKPDRLPRVCSEVHAPGPYSAPCSPMESYVSARPAMTLALRYAAGTGPAHVEFLARYEFVDIRQWGDPTPDGGPCDRTFSVRPDRLFASPRDVFMFGRGGAKRLRCVYTFQVEPYQRVSLRILRSKMGTECNTVYRNSSRRYECSHAGESGHPAIKIREEPWPNVPAERACLCNVTNGRPFNLVSYTNTIHITFSVPYMSPTNDYDDYFFAGEYSVLEAPLEVTEGCNDTTRRLGGRYGNFTVGAGRGELCASLPRLIVATDASFLFMRVRGFAATEDNCEVASRINVYAAGAATPIASICPERRDVYTHIFSSGWEDYEFNFQYEEDPFSYQNTTSLSTTSLSTSSLSTTSFSTTSLSTTTTLSTTTLSTTTLSTSSFSTTSMTTFLEDYEEEGPKEPPQSRDLFVEYIGNYSGRFLVTWIGIWRPLKVPSLMPSGVDPCPHRCPDISACLPEELWCDGIPHCPSGSDEGAAACGLLATLPWVYLIAAGVLLLSLVSLFIAVVVHKRQSHTQKVVVAAATAAVNNGTGMKSNTQDLLIPPENDTW